MAVSYNKLWKLLIDKNLKFDLLGNTVVVPVIKEVAMRVLKI